MKLETFYSRVKMAIALLERAQKYVNEAIKQCEPNE